MRRIRARDTKFTDQFRSILEQQCIESALLPPRSPILNASLERFFRSLKSECLDQMIFFGERSLRNATAQLVEHYLAERNHQVLENKRIEPRAEVGQATGEVECRQRLGGLLNTIIAGPPDRTAAAPAARSFAQLAPPLRADLEIRPPPRHAAHSVPTHFPPRDRRQVLVSLRVGRRFSFLTLRVRFVKRMGELDEPNCVWLGN